MPSPWGKPSLLVACFLALAMTAGGGEPGHVYYQRLAAPDLDRWTNAPDAPARRWLRDYFFRMGVFSPYFDARTAWYANALVYRDLYGIPTDSPVFGERPDWVLHDPHGRP